ncbi:MAG: hypothetical protein ACI39N_01600 [Lachnospiraceae bacterium]
MISKEEAILKLKKMGIQMAEDNSVVTVLVSTKQPMKEAVRETKERLQAIGYEGSFAVKQVKATPEDFYTEEENGQFSLGDLGMDF